MVPVPPYFGPGTCLRHRELFVTIMIERGIRDPLVMERIRMFLMCEVGRVFSRQQIRQWLIDRCAGCDREPWFIATLEKIAEEEAALIEQTKRP